MERTLVLLKPDAYARRLIGVLTSTLERRGLMLVACRLTYLDRSVLLEHYGHLKGRDFFEGLLTFMQSAPVLAQCWAGPEAVSTVRRMVGDTNSRVADPGTLRGTFAMSGRFNLIHASDSLESAEIEVARFFSASDIVEPPSGLLGLVYAPNEI